MKNVGGIFYTIFGEVLIVKVLSYLPKLRGTPQSQFGGVNTDFTPQLISLLCLGAHQQELF